MGVHESRALFWECRVGAQAKLRPGAGVNLSIAQALDRLRDSLVQALKLRARPGLNRVEADEAQLLPPHSFFALRTWSWPLLRAILSVRSLRSRLEIRQMKELLLELQE